MVEWWSGGVVEWWNRGMAEWWHVGKTLQILKDRIAKRQHDENLPLPPHPIPKRRNERWNDGKSPEIRKDGSKTIKPPVLGQEEMELMLDYLLFDYTSFGGSFIVSSLERLIVHYSSLKRSTL